MYTVEYAKTGRASCKLCNDKIVKGGLRIGKQVHVERGDFMGIGMGWFHFNCFWRQGPTYKVSRVWSNFGGVTQLKVEDQKLLHLNVFGTPMPEHVCVEAARIEAEERKKKTEAEAAKQRAKYAAKGEEAAVLASTDTDALLKDMLAKHLDKLKVPELKATCTEHKIILDKKAKRANIVKAILDQELAKIPGLLYQCLAKGCSVDNLKVLLKGKGQPVSGTKEVLLQRLLQALGASPPSAAQISTAQVKPKEKKKKESYDDYFLTEYGVYKKDESESALVRVARSGSLAELNAELANLPQDTRERAAVVNHARRWTEVEEKWGYDKSWEWFDSTAITVAARRGELAMVKALLLAGADPTLVGCHTDNENENSAQAAESAKKNALSALRGLEEGKLTWSLEREVKAASYCSDVDQQASKMASGQLHRLATASLLQDLLALACKHWPTAGYASSHYSEGRKKSFATSPNAPRDYAAFIKEIEEFDLCTKVDETRQLTLTTKYKQLLLEKQKEREVELRNVEQQRAAAALARQRRLEEGRAAALERRGVQNSQQQMKWKPNLPATIRQQLGSIQTQGAGGRECKSAWCDKLPAFACPQAKCANCCTGPCQRHAK